MPLVYRVEDTKGEGPFWGNCSCHPSHAAKMPSPYEDFGYEGNDSWTGASFYERIMFQWEHKYRFGVANTNKLLRWFGPDFPQLEQLGFFVSCYDALIVEYAKEQVLFHPDHARRLWRSLCTRQLLDHIQLTSGEML